MATTEVTTRDEPPRLPEKIERALVAGDLAGLSPAERVEFYNLTCESLGLNPLTKPFGYIVLNGKLTLYALKGCTDQLREKRGIAITELRHEDRDGVYTVFVAAKTRDGREDQDMAAVVVNGLKGDALCNARMKCITKAKRRVTLSLCGLGLLDETEVETIPGAKPADESTPPTRPPIATPRRLEVSHDAPVPERPRPRVDARPTPPPPAAAPSGDAGQWLNDDPAEEMRERAAASVHAVVATVGTPPAGERKPGCLSQTQIALLMASCHRYDVKEQELSDYLGTLGYKSKKDVPVKKLDDIIGWVAAQQRSHARIVSSRRRARCD